MSKFLFALILNLITCVIYAQTVVYHVDTSEYHLRPSSEDLKSECISYKDTSKIEMHTWYYYKSGMVITDSSYYSKGKLVREQNLFQKSSDENNTIRLTYHFDTVFVTINGPYYSHNYSAIKMSEFDSVNYHDTDMKLFGWSVGRDQFGQITDSIYYLDDQIKILKMYHQNGQLERHEYIEDGQVKTLLYKENGKRINRKKRVWSKYVYYLDSVDIKYHTIENEAIFNCFVERDTSIVKMFTWVYYRPLQCISDSSYYLNGDLITEQELYWFLPEKIISDKFIYNGDTVYHESYRTTNTNYSQQIKTVSNDDEDNWYSVFGYKTDYKLFGWSVTKHDKGYIMDSTYYENGEVRITKQYYQSGQLKIHRYQTSEGRKMLEYKKNGKIRNRMDPMMKHLIVSMALTNILITFIL